MKQLFVWSDYLLVLIDGWVDGTIQLNQFGISCSVQKALGAKNTKIIWNIFFKTNFITKMFKR